MPFTQKEIRERHRSQQWVKEKEASYAVERYASIQANPELYERRLKQARESAACTRAIRRASVVDSAPVAG